MKIIYRPYYDYPFEIFELEPKVKMVNHQRLSSLTAFKATDENIKLMGEYNTLLEESDTLRQKAEEIRKKMTDPI